MQEIAVLGLGNVLIGDDAFGPHVVRRFAAEYDPGPYVYAVDFGTPGFDLAPFLMEAPTIVIVDTVAASGSPGELRFYEKEDILRAPLRQRVNPHDPGLKDALLLLDLQGVGPHTVHLVGVIPEAVTTGIAMSAAVRAAVPRALDAIAEILAQHGHPPLRRTVPLDANLWWEADFESAIA